MTKIIRVAAAVIREGDRIFATARGYGDYKGWWEFPGGKIEPGETSEQALKREIQEELDTEIEVGELIHTVEYDYPNFHLSMDCFWCSVVRGELTLKEAEDARWLTGDNIGEVKWLPADLGLIEIIRKELKEDGANNTLDYYNKNAENYVQSTREVDFSAVHEKFLTRLDEGAYILDFGCGSGRDTKVFLEYGFAVEAIDGSEELCRMASEYTGITVKQMLFQELDENECYDGIWACASILHLQKDELKEVLKKMAKALKTGGYIYSSFKYGTFEGIRNGRYFTDFTYFGFQNFVKDLKELELELTWITGDVREGRDGEQWLNVLMRKR